MIFRHEYVGGVWVDLEQPDGNEIRQVAREFGLNDRIERELLAPTPVPTVAGNEDMVLVVLHFPAHGEEDGETKSQEIDFVVGKNFILTVRYEVVAPLHHLKKLLEAQALIGGRAKVTTDVLLEVLFAHLYTSMRDHTNHVAANLSRVEKEMFDRREHATVRAISSISREFLHVEAALVNQEESLRHFFEALEKNNFFGPAFAGRAQRITAERSHVERVVRMHRAVAGEMRETNNALLSATQNQVIKTLTVVNFIFLPLGLMSWIFAMRTEGMPIIDSPHAFWIVISMMLVVGSLLTVFFARKRWF